MMGLCGFLEPRQIGNLSRIRGLNLFSAMLFVNREHLSLLHVRDFLSQVKHTRRSTVVLTITIGTLIWFWTLREKSEYSKMWDASETKMKEYLQDHVRFFLPYESDSYYTDSWSLIAQFECCGYWNSTAILANSKDSTNDEGSFCGTMMNNAMTSMKDVQGCVGPISLFAE